MDLALQRYAGFALLAAALFGASAPLAKRLLGEVSPLVLAGLLYLGSGIGLLAVHLIRRAFKSTLEISALHVRDYAWLASAILAGGICAPVLLLWGLRGTSASATSLLLNFEGILTALLASLVFGEAVGRRIWAAAAVMLLAGIALLYSPSVEVRQLLPAAAVIAACALWALDNNLTRNIAGADALTVSMYKGLVAGGVNLGLGWLAGATLPPLPIAIEAAVIGLCSYGLSLVLFIIALRHLGSARTSAHFGAAPFFGVALSFALLNEPVSAGFVVGLAMMLFATWLVLTEQHQHPHRHTAISHAHLHGHDEHHAHAHSGEDAGELHAHPHVHEQLRHSHSHLPDLHHRHDH